VASDVGALLSGAGARDHGDPTTGGDLGEGDPQPARRAVHIKRGGVDAPGRVGKDRIGGDIVGQVDRQLEIEVRGEPENVGGGGQDVLRIAADGRVQHQHRIAGRETFDPFADFLDTSGALRADHRGQRRLPLVDAGAQEHVGLPHPNGVGPHQDMARLGLRDRQIDESENLRPPILGDLDRLQSRVACETTGGAVPA
jgi:hypothetical protein